VGEQQMTWGQGPEVCLRSSAKSLRHWWLLSPTIHLVIPPATGKATEDVLE